MFARALEELHRREGARLLALLIRRVGRFDVAEEAMQDAYERALRHWPQQGVPARPEAWLLRVAAHRAVDVLRRDAKSVTVDCEWLDSLEAPEGAGAETSETWPDERLKLIFTCCHPALAPSAQVALALRTLCGLTTSEIARAFVEPEATTAQKLVRAKRKIALSGIPYEVPPRDALPARLSTVLATIYFVFNEGYLSAASANLTRRDLCLEAIRLGSMLHALMPDEPEVAGLYALMRLHDARRAARSDENGDLIALEDQDRRLWDQTAIAAADSDLKCALARRTPGPYQLQAAIAALHATAPNAEVTDWAQISALYEKLAIVNDTPVIQLNAAVAQAMRGDMSGGMARIDALRKRGDLADYHLLYAARADLLRRAGRVAEAARDYWRALSLADNETERRYLASRLAMLEPRLADEAPQR
jgi:RNA polymerase sigma-70 factor (ECF subfamily)